MYIICIYIYLYIYVCIYIYIHIYTYVYIFILSQQLGVMSPIDSPNAAWRYMYIYIYIYIYARTSLQLPAFSCNSLQLPATHCNTLQQALLEKRSVVVSAPTGSGKTVCGEAAVYLGVAMGKRTFLIFVHSRCWIYLCGYIL